MRYPLGARVLFDGLPYEAKWSTQGDAPTADPDNPWTTPWTPLAPRPGEETTASTTTSTSGPVTTAAPATATTSTTAAPTTTTAAAPGG